MAVLKLAMAKEVAIELRLRLRRHFPRVANPPPAIGDPLHSSSYPHLLSLSPSLPPFPRNLRRASAPAGRDRTTCTSILPRLVKVRFPHPPPPILTRSAFLCTYFFGVQEVFRDFVFFFLQNVSFFSVSDSVAGLGDSCELVCGVWCW